MRTLKSILIASVIALPIAAPALAADAIMEQPPVPAPVEVAPQLGWAGGYTGLHLGYGWNTFKTNKAGVGNIKSDKFKMGAFAGWNFQQDNIVYGVEGDAGYSWAKKTVGTIQAKEGFEGSLRARLGVDMGVVMPYVTGGVAGAQIKLSDETSDTSKFRVGYTVGAGLEAKLTENVLGRVEYRYTDFGNKNYSLDSGNIKSKLQTNDIRLGVAYKF
ncbi:outer membrane protein [Brucellaceae bacterium C25G]